MYSSFWNINKSIKKNDMFATISTISTKILESCLFNLGELFTDINFQIYENFRRGEMAGL